MDNPNPNPIDIQENKTTFIYNIYNVVTGNDSWAYWREAQGSDTECLELMNHINYPNDPNNKDLKFLAIASQFEIIEGVLVRIEYRQHRKEYQNQVYVPAYLRLSVLEENHDNIAAGHLGIKKTHEKVRQKYYWRGIYRDTSHYVRKCYTCGAKKGALTPNTGEANAIFTSKSETENEKQNKETSS